jgi:predicted ATPase/class 3 adenylate cyclase
MRRDLPTGTVTFVFTDIEGSTRLLEELGSDRYGELLSQHHHVCRVAWAAHGGVEVDTAGDAFFVAFPTASGALAATGEAQQALTALGLRVRMGVHTGEVQVGETGYVGFEVHRAARIAAAAHGGQVVVSGPAATAAGVDRLVELGEHRFKDVSEPVAIFQLGEGSFPPLKTLSNTNLPRPASSFVGRERELAEVVERVERGARLVTLTGPGGSGKTRLALEAATTLVPAFKAGVFWVGLAALRDPELVPETIAQTLGAKDRLAEHIGERELLLLLDNLEQVIDAAPDVSRLLRECPSLAIVVTSRELLRVDGEVEYAVPPLAEPEAVALFHERAGLEPSEEIRDLCARLDNLPLAVELAAARTRVLSPTQILERLSQRLDLLKGGRDADPRQQTLRATIEWSYDLLSEHEQRLFRALAVFAGGCTLEAAEHVAGADLDTLQSLVEKSLLRFTSHRYWMLETIREFASECLRESGQAAVLERQHRQFFLDLADSNAPGGYVVELGAVQRIVSERDNLRAAIHAAAESQDWPFIAEALSFLWPVLLSTGTAHEGIRWARLVLAERDHLSEHDLHNALVAGGELTRHVGEMDEAEALKLELVELSHPGDYWLAATLADLSDIALERGDIRGARAYAERSVAVGGGGARGLFALAEVELREGDLGSAERHFAECAERFKGVHDFNHGFALEALAETVRRQGDGARARALFAAAARHFSNLGDQACVGECLDGLAAVAMADHDTERAAVLSGAAERLRAEWGRPALRKDRRLHDLSVTAHERGRSLSLDEALAYALANVD